MSFKPNLKREKKSSNSWTRKSIRAVGDFRFLSVNLPKGRNSKHDSERERGKEIDIEYTLAKFIYSAHDVAIENNRRKQREKERALVINFPFSHKKSTEI